jgi:hypothetical protein
VPDAVFTFFAWRVGVSGKAAEKCPSSAVKVCHPAGRAALALVPVCVAARTAVAAVVGGAVRVAATVVAGTVVTAAVVGAAVAGTAEVGDAVGLVATFAATVRAGTKGSALEEPDLLFLLEQPAATATRQQPNAAVRRMRGSAG